MKNIFYSFDEHGVKNYNNLPILVISLLSFFGIVYLFGSAVLAFEADMDNSNVTNLNDALWLTYMAASTIGFGDHYPVSTGGRILIGSMFLVGAAMFGIILGLVHNMMMGWLDTNVKNRELRTELKELRDHNGQLYDVVNDLRVELAKLQEHDEKMHKQNLAMEEKIDELKNTVKPTPSIWEGGLK